MAFVEGYLSGLGLIVLIGPVLFVLLRSTLERGRAQGMAVAIGIFVSDVLAVALCALGAATFLRRPDVEPWLALAGGALLVGFGVNSWRAPAKASRAEIPGGAARLTGFFVRGFLVNFVNPFVFMVWLGIIAAASLRHGYGAGLFWFMAGSVLAVLTLDVSKVLLAHKIRPLLSPKALRMVLRVSGALLLAFGARLVLVGLGVR